MSGVGGDGGAAGPSSPAVLALADAGDITGRAAVPESTIGGETTCIVCMARPKSHIAVPCGHLCVCGVCAERMQDCPYCTAAEPSSSGCTRAWSDLEHTVFDHRVTAHWALTVLYRWGGLGGVGRGQGGKVTPKRAPNHPMPTSAKNNKTLDKIRGN